jgi:hypothetical protein
MLILSLTFNGDNDKGFEKLRFIINFLSINETACQSKSIEEGSKSVSRSLDNAGINVIIVLLLLI